MEINTIVVISIIKAFSKNITDNLLQDLLLLSEATAKRIIYGQNGQGHWPQEGKWPPQSSKYLKHETSFARQLVYVFECCFEEYLMSDLEVAKKTIVAELKKAEAQPDDIERITQMTDFSSIAEYLVKCAQFEYARRRAPKRRRVREENADLFIQGALTQIPTMSTHTRNIESAPSVSNELVLGIIWDNSAQRLAINDETQNRLKELYREFPKHGTKPVDIIFDISCITGSREIAEFLLRDDIASQYGYESALHVAEQELLTRIKAVKELLTVAFCHLFQDEMVDSYAARNSKRYVEKYGMQNCSYIDVDGIGNPSYYWTPYLWIEIVEEILKELLYSRYEFYYNSHDYIPIDCVARNRNGEEVWSFGSCMPRSQLECENKEIYWQLSHGCADMYDMPTQTLAEHILPDLYINISLLKTRNPHEAEALLINYPILFNLSYYSFGLH